MPSETGRLRGAGNTLLFFNASHSRRDSTKWGKYWECPAGDTTPVHDDQL